MPAQLRDLPLPTASDVQHMRYMTYVDVTTYTILVYDYLITFGREKALIWPMPLKSPIKVLFFLTRYMPFFDFGINMWHHFTDNMTDSGCTFAYKAMGFSIILGFIVAEATLTLRTWAIWSRSRTIGICLSVAFVSAWGSNLVVIAIFLDSVKFAPLPDNIPGCFVIAGSSIVAIDWILVMVYELFVLTLMLIKAFQTYQLHGQSHLYATVYRDGSLFYVYLTTLSIINVVIIVTLPADLATILSNFQHIIHAVLTGRIIMSLRALGMQPWEEENQSNIMPPIEFAHRQKDVTSSESGTTVC